MKQEEPLKVAGQIKLKTGVLLGYYVYRSFQRLIEVHTIFADFGSFPTLDQLGQHFSTAGTSSIIGAQKLTSKTNFFYQS